MLQLKSKLCVSFIASVSLSATAARADPMSVHFERSGQICLSAAEKQRLQAELMAHPLPEKGAVRLIAFSDQMDMAAPARPEQPACTTESVPPDLRGHARIAAARGLAYLEAAHAAAPERFAGLPVFVVGADPASLPAAQTGAVMIVLLRSDGQEMRDRRVDLVIPSPDKAPKPEKLPNEPRKSADEARPQIPPNAGPTTTLVLNAPATPLASRTLGVLAVAAGSASAALGAIFLGYASYQNASAARSFDRSESASMHGEAHSYARAGGISLGLGVALIVGGIVVLAMNPAKAPTSGASPGIRATGAGLALQW